MYYLQFRVLPADDHPEADLLGEAMVCCWIDRESPEAAEAHARTEISKEHWIIVECELNESVTEEDFADDEEFLEYYQQALEDREVFLFNQSPRFPVYWVTATVEEELSKEVAEAHYFLCGEELAENDEDVYDPDFWKGANEREAVKSAREALTEGGWVVKTITANRPVGRSDLPEAMVPYYDEAEAEGACLVFLHDDDVPGSGSE